jgi:hypothetical protein
MVKRDVDKKSDIGWCVHDLTPLRCTMGKLVSLTTGITEFISKVDGVVPEGVVPEPESDVWHVASGMVLAF